MFAEDFPGLFAVNKGHFGEVMKIFITFKVGQKVGQKWGKWGKFKIQGGRG